MTDDDEPRYLTRSVVHHILPDAAGARLARIFGVSNRTGQKWAAGQAPVPQEVVDFVNAEAASLYPEPDQPELDIQARLEAAIGPLLEPPHHIHREVLASHLALYYKRLVNREVE